VCLNQIENIKALNQEFGIDGRLSFESWKNFTPAARLRSSLGEMLVSLYGGQLLEASIAGRHSFWLSPSAFSERGKAIRGGVPVIFPWFGENLLDSSLPSHGFARTSFFEVRTSSSNELGTSLKLVLGDSNESRKLWPFKFELVLGFLLGSETGDNELSVELEITNTDKTSFSFSGGLHSYFRVGNAWTTTIPTPSCRYFDNLSKSFIEEQLEEIRFTNEVDRIYLGKDKVSVLKEKASKSVRLVEHSGHDSVVVWNPGPGSTKEDMPHSKEFICIETTLGAGARVPEDLVQLSPGETRKVGFVSKRQ